jgi:5-methylcytosine-specific restriction protein A
MKRPSFNRKERQRLRDLYKSTCYLCGGEITDDQAWEIEHVVMWELTHDNSDDNLRLAHAKCHKVKTADDIRGIRKADRIRAKNNGTDPPSPNPLRSGNTFRRRARAVLEQSS